MLRFWLFVVGVVSIVLGCGRVERDTPRAAPSSTPPSSASPPSPPSSTSPPSSSPPVFVFRPLADDLACTGHTATLLGDGRVLVRGACELEGSETSALLYHPELESFEKLDAAWRYGHTATLLSDGRVLFAGGRDDDAVSDALELFDPGENAISVAGKLLVPRAFHAAVRLDADRVLISGGRAADNATLDSVEFRDADGGSSVGPSLPAPRMLHVALRLPNGEAMIAGGGTESIAMFDPATNHWTNQAGLGIGPSIGSLSLLAADDVLGLSGVAAAMFDPATGAAELLATGVEIPFRATAAIAGKLLVVGGSPYAIPPEPALFDVAARTFAATSGGHGDYDVTATALDDGSVLVIGQGAELFVAQAF